LLYGITGDKAQSKLLTTQLKRQIKVHNGLFAGKKLAGHWAKNRFRSPYLRETLWQQGYVVDTLETCVSWANLDQMLNKIETSLNQTAAKFDEKIVVFSHLSHCYHDGATIYTSYIFRPGDSYQQALNRWELFKHAASTVIVENQGTISHQHGVGRDHAPYLAQEKGELTMAALKAEFAILDPDQRLNSGVICD
ncbi:MAG: FAD-binding oxidoreductase, partial [Gammaproteobacteria bacterium]|nr:FAD-binding oxidoreductase [Gammaproteobacteria bacterium]